METFVAEELPTLLTDIEGLDFDRVSISGHSMGGHGAISLALKFPGRYQSISAFSPICAPATCPWGKKAFSAYLGTDEALWKQHDSCDLILGGAPHIPLLVDQGASDPFIEEQLRPELLLAACKGVGFPTTYREQMGYDRIYFFIASFIEGHLRFHYEYLA